MKLLTVTALQAALGISGQLEKTNATMASALDNATARVAAELRADFTLRASVVENFYVRPADGFNLGTNSSPVWKGRFALKYGFLTAAPTFTYASTLAELTSAPVAVSNDYIATNLIKGDINVMGFDLRGRFVRATYACGFAADGNGVYTVPDEYIWLVEAAKGFASAELLRVAPTLVYPDKGNEDHPQQAPSPRNIERNALMILQEKIRYFPDAIRAVA